MWLQRQNSAIYHTLYNPALTTFPYCYSTSACVWVCPTDLHKNGSAQLLETFYPVRSRASLTLKLIRTPNRQWNWYAFGSTTTPTSTWNRNRAVGLDWPSDSQRWKKKNNQTQNKPQPCDDHLKLHYTIANWLTLTVKLRVAPAEHIQFKSQNTGQVFRSVRSRQDPLLATTTTARTNRCFFLTLSAMALQRRRCVLWCDLGGTGYWLSHRDRLFPFASAMADERPFSAIVPSPWPTPNMSTGEISDVTSLDFG